MKNKNLLKATFFTSLAFLTAEVLNAQSVNAQTTYSSDIYAPFWGGLCLDIANPNNQGPRSGARVLAYTCRGGNNQKWEGYSSPGP